jgi:hypothetical protein
MAKMEDNVAGSMLMGRVDGDGNFTPQEEGSFDGEICFEVEVPVIGAGGQPTGKFEKKWYTNSMLNKMVETGTRRHDLEASYLAEMATYRQMGMQGQSWPGDENVRRSQEAGINENDIPHLIAEDLGGKGSFSEHIKLHPDFAVTFADGNFTYTTFVPNVTKGKENEQVLPTDPESEGGATVTAAEIAMFNDEDLEMIINEMAKEKNHSVMKGYYSEYKMVQAKSNFEQGGGDLDPVNKETSDFRKWYYSPQTTDDQRKKWMDEHSWDELQKKLNI